VFVAAPRWSRPDSLSYKQHTRTLWKYVKGELPRQAYLAHFLGRGPLDAYARMERVADRVRPHARSGDTLCSRGFATPLYPLTGLRCPSRHIVEDVIHMGLPHWKAEYRRTLEKTPPSFVVTFTDRRPDQDYLKKRGYVLMGNEGKFSLFASAQVAARENLKPPPPSSPPRPRTRR
jgi:hypothetical protein